MHHVQAAAGLPDFEVTVKGPPMVDDGSPNPKMPAPSGVLQPIAAKILTKILHDARTARHDLLNAVCKTAA